MSLLESNWNPTVRQLRQFGGVCLAAFPLLAWLWSGSISVIVGFAVIGMLLCLVAIVYPRAILPAYIAMMIISMPIGIVVGEIAMILVYLIIFLPIAIVFRLTSRDRLKLKIDRQAKSYWQVKRQPKSTASYYRQS